jgi:hypothetical protein
MTLAVAGTTYVALRAHSIDYVGIEATFSPTAQAVGGSGNWTITNPVTSGTVIQFQLKYQIVPQGQTTTFPRTITFAANVPLKPAGASDPIVTGLVAHVFNAPTDSFTDTLTITAPGSPGAYQVKIAAASGTGGRDGLGPGNGIVISFTVAQPAPQCPLVVPTLTVQNQCNILLHQPEPITLAATLANGATPLGGRVVRFALDGVEIGQATTDSNGVATLLGVDVSGLSVGNHTVEAFYDGDNCQYASTSGSGNVGVEYLFQGFQQPINADGTSAFGGRTVPVKIKIVDYYGVPVDNAEAHVFFEMGTPTVIGTEAEPVANTNGDSGNLMRYDPTAAQYIFNWDIAGLLNGTYSIRVDLGEGTCGDPHVAVVSLKKKGSK